MSSVASIVLLLFGLRTERPGCTRQDAGQNKPQDEADDQVAPDRSSYGSLNGRLRRLLYGFQHFGEYASIDARNFPSSANRINAEVYRSIYSEYPMKTLR